MVCIFYMSVQRDPDIIFTGCPTGKDNIMLLCYILLWNYIKIITLRLSPKKKKSLSLWTYTAIFFYKFCLNESKFYEQNRPSNLRLPDIGMMQYQACMQHAC